MPTSRSRLEHLEPAGLSFAKPQTRKGCLYGQPFLVLKALCLLGQLAGSFGRVLALETGAFQLILAGLALALATGYGTSAVERTSGHFLVAHLALPNVRQTHNDETVVQHLGVERAKGFFLATVLVVLAKAPPTLPMNTPGPTGRRCCP